MQFRIARRRVALVARLTPLAEGARRTLAAGGDLESVTSNISTSWSLTWKDAEAALESAKRCADQAAPEASFVWATLALAVLRLIEQDTSSLIRRVQRTLLQGSGHAKRLQGYAYMVRGAAAVELGRLDEAHQNLEAAHTAYAASRVGEREALEVNLRLVNLQLVREDWQQAEWLAESTLRRLDRVGNSADRGECTLLLAHAQFGMVRLEAALNSIGQVLGDTDSREHFIRARAYLLKARVELAYNQAQEASKDCDLARGLFIKIGNQRGLRDCDTVREMIGSA